MEDSIQEQKVVAVGIIRNAKGEVLAQKKE